MEKLHLLDLGQQIVVQVPRQYGGSVLSALPASDEDEFWPKSTSWTRRRMHSISRNPLP
jgi:hypothetical protein